MLKFIWLLNNILLIILILIRTPNNSGLESFATKSTQSSFYLKSYVFLHLAEQLSNVSAI